jgi:hypothetical protein
MAIENPNNGEINNEFPIFIASPQLTPTFSVFQGNNENTIPAPSKEPIKVCELEQGIPKYQVPKFHNMAPTRTAMIMAMASFILRFKTVSRGKMEAILVATAIPKK